MRLSPAQRRDMADRLLAWLKVNGISNSSQSYPTLFEGSECTGIPMHDIWKAFNLLRLMGRVRLNNPNGKSGFRVIDYTPLTVYQLKSDNFKQDVQLDMLTTILSKLKKQYPNIWQDAVQRTEAGK